MFEKHWSCGCATFFLSWELLPLIARWLLLLWDLPLPCANHSLPEWLLADHRPSHLDITDENSCPEV